MPSASITLFDRLLDPPGSAISADAEASIVLMRPCIAKAAQTASGSALWWQNRRTRPLRRLFNASRSEPKANAIPRSFALWTNINSGNGVFLSLLAQSVLGEIIVQQG